MKIFIKKIYLLIFILPLLGAVSYKSDQITGCEGLPDFRVESDGKVTLNTKSVNKIEENNQIIVLGEVKNTTNKLLGEITVTGTLKDKDGNTIDSKSVLIDGESRRLEASPDTIDHSSLAPGATGSFKITADKPSDTKVVDRVETTVTSKKEDLLALNAKMTATVTKSKTDNKLTIKGNLKNNSQNISTWNNKIVITVKNKAGLIVDIEEENLGDTLTINGKQKEFAMNPGDVKTFLFDTDVNFDTVGKMTSSVNWEEEGPSSPAAPSDLEGSIDSATEVSLTFEDNSDNEDGFKLFRKTGNGKFKKIKTLAANSDKSQPVTTSDTGLSLNKTYSYRVRAFNEIGNSDASNTAKISISIPVTPENLKASVKSATEIDLSWDDKSNTEIGFSILRDSIEIATVGADTTTYKDTNVVLGTTYSYQVSAFNGIGSSSVSNSQEITLDKPNAPSDLLVTAITSTHNKLTWTDNSNNEDGFKIERKPNDGEYSQIATVGIDETTYDDKLVNPATTYKYRVRAFNGIGDSDPSNEAP